MRVTVWRMEGEAKWHKLENGGGIGLFFIGEGEEGEGELNFLNNKK